MADIAANPAAGDIVPRLLAAPTSRAVEATEAAAGDQAAPSQPQTGAQQQAGQPKAEVAYLSGQEHREPQSTGHTVPVSPEKLAPPSRVQQLWKVLSCPRGTNTAASSVNSNAAASTAQLESSTPDPVSDNLGSALVQATKAENQDAAKSTTLEIAASMDAQNQPSVQGRAGQAWGASLWGAASKLLPWRASWPRSAMPCTRRAKGVHCAGLDTGLQQGVACWFILLWAS